MFTRFDPYIYELFQIYYTVLGNCLTATDPLIALEMSRTCMYIILPPDRNVPLYSGSEQQAQFVMYARVLRQVSSAGHLQDLLDISAFRVVHFVLKCR